MNKEINKVTNSIPYAFYDIVVYVVPSVIYLSVLIFEGSLNYSFADTEKMLIQHHSWVFDIFVGILAIAILYTLGLIVATFSYWIIKRPTIFYLKKRNKINKNVRSDFGTLMLEIQQEKDLHIYNEMVKKYARVILLRNLSLTIPLIYISKLILNQDANRLAFYIIFFLIVYVAYYNRHIWFLDNINQINKEERKRTDNNA